MSGSGRDSIVGAAVLASWSPPRSRALGTLLTGMPRIGAVTAAGGFPPVVAHVGPMLLGAILGRRMA
jgi:hypothetical protein